MNAAPANYTRTARGLVAALCQFCGCQAKATRPNDSGEPDLWAMPRGWSEAPYPADHRHADGSIGSRYTCPDCNCQLRAGATLQTRGGQAARNVAHAPEPLPVNSEPIGKSAELESTPAADFSLADLLALAGRVHSAAIISADWAEVRNWGRAQHQAAFHAAALQAGVPDKTQSMGFVVTKCLSLSGYGS